MCIYLLSIKSKQLCVHQRRCEIWFINPSSESDWFMNKKRVSKWGKMIYFWLKYDFSWLSQCLFLVSLIEDISWRSTHSRVACWGLCHLAAVHRTGNKVWLYIWAEYLWTDAQWLSGTQSKNVPRSTNKWIQTFFNIGQKTPNYRDFAVARVEQKQECSFLLLVRSSVQLRELTKQF